MKMKPWSGFFGSPQTCELDPVSQPRSFTPTWPIFPRIQSIFEIKPDLYVQEVFPNSVPIISQTFPNRQTKI